MSFLSSIKLEPVNGGFSVISYYYPGETLTDHEEAGVTEFGVVQMAPRDERRGDPLHVLLFLQHAISYFSIGEDKAVSQTHTSFPIFPVTSISR